MGKSANFLMKAALAAICAAVFAGAGMVSTASAARLPLNTGTVNVSVVSTSQINVTATYSAGASCGGGGDTTSTFQVEWQIAGGDWSGKSTGPLEADGDAISPYTYPITGLSAGTSYDIRVVYNDGDGVDACTTPVTATVPYASNPATTMAVCVPTISDCSGCHGMPPVDWDGVSAKAGTTYHKGDHIAAHVGSGTRADCAMCHYNYQTMTNVTSVERWTFAHSDRAMDIYTSNNLPNNLGFAAPYDKGIKGGYYKGYTNMSLVYLNNEPGLKNVCTNTYCHGAGDSPVWGSGTAACGSCHGIAPATGNHPIHSQGLVSGGDSNSGSVYDFGCYKCHNNQAIHTQGPQSADRAADVTFGGTATPFNEGGSYTEGTLAGTDGTLEWTDGTCSGLYCHSDAKGGSPNTTPTWNGSMAANCAGCHGGTAASGTPMGTGKHNMHISSGTYGFGCDKCHNDTTTTGTGVTDTTFHVNSSIDVAFDTQNSSGSFAGTTCSTMYCHGDGTASNGSADWTGGALNCTGCHDWNAGAAPNDMSTGKHTAHINNGNMAAFTCSQCHKNTVSSGDSPITGYAKHVNGTKDVSFTAFNTYTGALTGTKTCRNVYCHSSGQADPNFRVTDAWTGGATATCDYCHGADNFYALTDGAPDYENISTVDRNTFNSHQVHVAADSDCVKCHDTTVDAAKAVIASSDHLSGAREVSFAKGGNYNNTTKRCDNTDCHGVTVMRWGGGLPASCQSCHTDQGAGTYGSHGYTGKHSTHTNTYGFACELCHATKNAAGNTDHAGGDVSANHAAEVFFNTTATVMTSIQYDGGGTSLKYIQMDAAYGLTGITPSYTPWTTMTPQSDPVNANRKWTEGRCGNIWCHSNANPMGGTMTYASFPNWSTAETTNCTSCHGGPGTYASVSLSATHKQHAGSDRYGFNCSECHNDTVSTGDSPVTDYTMHVNGVKNVVFDPFGLNSTASYATPTCSALYCHGNGDGIKGGADWGTTLNCGSCHNYTVASGSAMSSRKHTQHINNGNLGVFECSNCHARTVQTNNTTIIYANAKHVNTAKDVAIAFNGYTGLYTGSFTCQNTYCHSSGQATPAFRVTPAWNSGTNLDCDGCHGAEGASYVAGAPEYPNVSTVDRNSFNGHYVSGHVSGISDCAKCHSTTVDGSQGILATGDHLSGTREVSFALGGSYANKRCSGTDTGCHGASTLRWGGTAACIDCHSTTGAETDDYTYGNATRATVNFYEWTSVGHGKTGTYRYTGRSGANKVCEDCHTSAVAHNDGNNPFRLANADTVVLCNGCHSAGIGNHDFAHVAQGNWTWTPKCVDCHDPHGDTGGVTSSEYNGAMVQRAVSYTESNTYGVPGSTEAVDFPANYARAKGLNLFNWSSFVVPTGQSNKGVCRVCHADPATTYFTRTTYSTHKSDQGACISCHVHSEGFKPSCDSCHGYPPNITDNHQDNVGAVGAHDKHVAGQGLACLDCHKGNTHNQTNAMAPYTSLVNPTFVNMSVTSDYSLHGTEPTYNGTPGSWTPYKTCGTTACHYDESPSWDCQ